MSQSMADLQSHLSSLCQATGGEERRNEKLRPAQTGKHHRVISRTLELASKTEQRFREGQQRWRSFSCTFLGGICRCVVYKSRGWFVVDFSHPLSLICESFCPRPLWHHLQWSCLQLPSPVPSSLLLRPAGTPGSPSPDFTSLVLPMPRAERLHFAQMEELQQLFS